MMILYYLNNMDIIEIRRLLINDPDLLLLEIIIIMIRDRINIDICKYNNT